MAEDLNRSERMSDAAYRVYQVLPVRIEREEMRGARGEGPAAHMSDAAYRVYQVLPVRTRREERRGARGEGRGARGYTPRTACTRYCP